MILLLRLRFPRLAAVLGALSGFVTLGLAIACHASPMVYVVGCGSSLALAAVRFVGKRTGLDRLAAEGRSAAH